jgi:type I restriction enzyme S subunit
MSITTDWQTMTIEEATERLIDYRGKTPPKTKSGVRLITAKVVKGGRILDDKPEFIAADFYDQWMRRGLPQQWDVLITTEAPLGEVAILRDPERIALAQRIILLRGDPQVVNQKYLFYALQSDFTQGELRGRATGTTVSGIKQSELRLVRLQLPSLPNQRKIAGILSAYDDLIENNLRRISILEEMAQSLYREWFVHFRFPGHEDVAMVDSPLGPIPGGWEVKKILDFADVIYGYSFKSKQFNTSGDGEPVVRIRDVLKGRSETFTLEEGDPKHRIENGDILVGMDGDFHMSIWSGGEAWQNQRVAKFRSKGGIGINLLFRILQAPIQFFNATITGTTVAHLGDKHIKTIQFAAPPTNLLLHASEIFEPFATEQLNLKQRNQNLRQTRDLLLPKLLSPSV